MRWLAASDGVNPATLWHCRACMPTSCAHILCQSCTAEHPREPAHADALRPLHLQGLHPQNRQGAVGSSRQWGIAAMRGLIRACSRWPAAACPAPAASKPGLAKPELLRPTDHQPHFQVPLLPLTNQLPQSVLPSSPPCTPCHLCLFAGHQPHIQVPLLPRGVHTPGLPRARVPRHGLSRRGGPAAGSTSQWCRN